MDSVVPNSAALSFSRSLTLIGRRPGGRSRNVNDSTNAKLFAQREQRHLFYNAGCLLVGAQGKLDLDR